MVRAAPGIIQHFLEMRELAHFEALITSVFFTLIHQQKPLATEKRNRRVKNLLGYMYLSY